eukprot:TRINITY_DN49890_c0_g1_i1.p1 TRINITY_DN49890_c0_g1~~TRINITY_DN49890_c0_g1_i1.p1  ORF type:complete len:467 (+),score=40.80 TRINITY_DN49890_c0_g1_i1:75-1475(+)
MSVSSRSVLPSKAKPLLQDQYQGMLVAGLQILGFKGTLEEKPFERPNTMLLANILYFLHQKHFGEEFTTKVFQDVWPPKDIGRVPALLPQKFTKIIVEWIHDLNKSGYIEDSLSLACKSLLQRAQGPRLVELLCGLTFKTLEGINQVGFNDEVATTKLNSFLLEEKNLPEDLQFVMLSVAKTQIKELKEEALHLEHQLAEQWNVSSAASKELQDLENKSLLELQESRRKAQERGVNISENLDEFQQLAKSIADETRQRQLARLKTLWNSFGEEIAQQCKHKELIQKCMSEDLYVNAISGKRLQLEAGISDIQPHINLNKVLQDATRSLASFQQQINGLSNSEVKQTLQLLGQSTQGSSQEQLEHVCNKHRQQVEYLKQLKADLITEIKQLDKNNPILIEEIESTLQGASSQYAPQHSQANQEIFTPSSSHQRSPAMALMPPTPPIRWLIFYHMRQIPPPKRLIRFF